MNKTEETLAMTIAKFASSAQMHRRLVRLLNAGRLEQFECQYENCILPSRTFEKVGGAKPVIDHVVSKSAGGPDIPENWQVIHYSCNSSKAAHDKKLIKEYHAEWMKRNPESKGTHSTGQSKPSQPQRHLNEDCVGWWILETLALSNVSMKLACMNPVISITEDGGRVLTTFVRGQRVEVKVSGT